ncbi:MAG: hypothetical protein LBC68_05640, partial [Prevotellaceae bacterium]|nr:hypothetical protein [Prevotellaceae bacterium]
MKNMNRMITKQQTFNLIAGVLAFIATATVLSTVFALSRDLGNGTVSSKYFWFYGSMALMVTVAVPVAAIRCRERLRFKLPDLLILLFCVAAILITLYHSGRLTNKCILLGFATLFYFYLRIFFSGRSKLLCYLCCVAFVVTGLVEAVWGLMQLYGFAGSQHGLFKITGSFFNPGPYAGWLATVFPVALGLSLKLFINHKGHTKTINHKGHTEITEIINHKGHEVTQSSSFITHLSSFISHLSYLITHLSSLLTVICTL